MTDLVQKVTADDLATVLRDRGFRAEKVEWPAGREALRSAAGGVGFNVILGNGQDGAYNDFTYFANFRLEGLPLDDVCDEWNRGRRFMRAHSREGLLNVEMDVTLGTGVDRNYVGFTVELWNQLLNELLAALRERAAKAGVATGTAPEAGTPLN